MILNALFEENAFGQELVCLLEDDLQVCLQKQGNPIILLDLIIFMLLNRAYKQVSLIFINFAV